MIIKFINGGNGEVITQYEVVNNPHKVGDIIELNISKISLSVNISLEIQKEVQDEVDIFTELYNYKNVKLDSEDKILVFNNLESPIYYVNYYCDIL